MKVKNYSSRYTAGHLHRLHNYQPDLVFVATLHSGLCLNEHFLTTLPKLMHMPQTLSTIYPSALLSFPS